MLFTSGSNAGQVPKAADKHLILCLFIFVQIKPSS